MEDLHQSDSSAGYSLVLSLDPFFQPGIKTTDIRGRFNWYQLIFNQFSCRIDLEPEQEPFFAGK